MKTYRVEFALLQQLCRTITDECSIDNGYEVESAEKGTLSNIQRRAL